MLDDLSQKIIRELQEDARQSFREIGRKLEVSEGTVRNLYAESKGRNAVHGSDSDENARIEGTFFFGAAALV